MNYTKMPKDTTRHSRNPVHPGTSEPNPHGLRTVRLVISLEIGCSCGWSASTRDTSVRAALMLWGEHLTEDR